MEEHTITDNELTLIKGLLIIILVGTLYLIPSATAYYSGETIEKNVSEFGLFYFSNVWIQENNTFINLTWTNESFKVIIPETFIGNIRVGFQGYNDKPEIITDSYSGSGGGSSYAPKKAIVIYPNQTSNNTSIGIQSLENKTISEFTETPKDSPSLFSKLWDWLVNLFRRMFG